jgi:hypothetical protein
MTDTQPKGRRLDDILAMIGILFFVLSPAWLVALAQCFEEVQR